MRKSNHQAIRNLLRENEDGMTVAQLAEVIGAHKSTLQCALNNMPDAYIDRWARTASKPAAVWCVVVPPPNCPRPDPKRKPRVNT